MSVKTKTPKAGAGTDLRRESHHGGEGCAGTDCYVGVTDDELSKCEAQAHPKQLARACHSLRCTGVSSFLSSRSFFSYPSCQITLTQYSDIRHMNELGTYVALKKYTFIREGQE